MANPTWVTAENIKFDGTTTDVAVLKDANNVRSVVIWDNLSTADQTFLTTLVDAFGGTVPLAGPTAGVQKVLFTGTLAGGDATGLSAVASATAGTATIDLGASKLAGDASGLSAAAGTAGYAVANYQPGVVSGTSLGLTAPTAGSQTVDLGGTATGGAATNLVAETTYTATVTVDGVGLPISILGSDAATFTDLVSQLNTDLGSAATAALTGGDIVITSATYGALSSVVITAGTLFAAPLEGFVDINTSVVGSGTTSYTMSVSIDGVAYPVTLDPLVTTTFGGLVTLVNTAIGANGTAALSGGDFRVTSATVGTSSKVVITVGTLLPLTAGFVGLLPPANGGGTARTYSATVVVDGTKIKTVSFSGVAGATIQDVLDEINTDLGADATAALTGGDIVITSASTGTASSVSVYDSGFLFGSLTDYTGVAYVSGTAPKTYSVNITVDGVVVPVSFTGNVAQTFTTLLSAMNTDLGAAATATISGNALVITSATTGTTSSVSIAPGTLFQFLTGFASIAPSQAGASDFMEVMTRRTPSGEIPVDVIPVKVVGDKPAVPPNVAHSTDFIYFDGTVWKYLDDDTTV